MREVGAPVRILAGLLGGVVVAATVFDFPPLAGQSWWPVLGTILVGGAVGWSILPLRILLHLPGMTPIALLGWLAAIYGCVPETGQVRPVAAWLVALFVVEVIWGRPAPWLAHLAAAMLVLWAGVFGATGQERAIVGALFGAWGLFIGPLAAVAVPPLRRAPLLARWVICGIGGVGALIVARTGALRPAVGGAIRSAAVWATVTTAVALLLALVVTSPSARRRPPLP